MRVNDMRFYALFLAVFLAATSARAQEDMFANPNTYPFIALKTYKLDDPDKRSFGKAERVRIGMKYIQEWGLDDDRTFAENWFGDGPDAERTLLSFIEAHFFIFQRGNEKGLRALTKAMREGDKLSAKLLGILMFVAGNRLPHHWPYWQFDDSERFALYRAARHFGYINKFWFSTGQFFRTKNDPMSEESVRTQEFIRNPLLILHPSVIR